ncbi:MAG: RNase adapter RapZ [Ruaniaceae bacterium]|nr:RNase adapter RapZ [Ruaniaceae bacterium]
MSEQPTIPDDIPARDEDAALPAAERPELLIVTGMSGAGKTRAVAALEDLDWYVVDNLPPQLLTMLARMLQGNGGITRLAVVVDARTREFFDQAISVVDQLRGGGLNYRIVFLDASDEVLVRRFEAVRRPHPLQGEGRILDGISRERALLAELRNRADAVIDTSELSVHGLARQVRGIVDDPKSAPLHITVMSFGFKYGIPLDADHVVDVRFLANPYWVTELRHLTGHDSEVRSYVLAQDGARDFITRYVAAIKPIMGGYVHELKPYVTIAVGCTGGKHRSVAIAEVIAQELRDVAPVRTLHRDLGME